MQHFKRGGGVGVVKLANVTKFGQRRTCAAVLWCCIAICTVVYTSNTGNTMTGIRTLQVRVTHVTGQRAGHDKTSCERTRQGVLRTPVHTKGYPNLGQNGLWGSQFANILSCNPNDWYPPRGYSNGLSFCELLWDSVWFCTYRF